VIENSSILNGAGSKLQYLPERSCSRKLFRIEGRIGRPTTKLYERGVSNHTSVTWREAPGFRRDENEKLVNAQERVCVLELSSMGSPDFRSVLPLARLTGLVPIEIHRKDTLPP